MQILNCTRGFSVKLPVMGLDAGLAHNGLGPDPQPKPV